MLFTVNFSLYQTVTGITVYCNCILPNIYYLYIYCTYTEYIEEDTDVHGHIPPFEKHCSGILFNSGTVVLISCVVALPFDSNCKTVNQSVLPRLGLRSFYSEELVYTSSATYGQLFPADEV